MKRKFTVYASKYEGPTLRDALSDLENCRYASVSFKSDTVAWIFQDDAGSYRLEQVGPNQFKLSYPDSPEEGVLNYTYEDVVDLADRIYTGSLDSHYSVGGRWIGPDWDDD